MSMICEDCVCYDYDQELEAFYGRSDEIGMIAQTIHRVCACLRKTIDDVSRILGEMAAGNLAIDVAANESYYIGDFKALSASLRFRSEIISLIMPPIFSVDRGLNKIVSSRRFRNSGLK